MKLCNIDNQKISDFHFFLIRRLEDPATILPRLRQGRGRIVAASHREATRKKQEANVKEVNML